MSFHNKTIIVTGAASGIGAATSTHFAELGAEVLALDRDESALETLVLGAKGNITPLVGDVTDPSLPDMLAAHLDQIGSRLSVLVNNAGIGGGGRLDQTDEDTLRRYLEVNLVSLFRLCRFAVARMQDTGGAIVNIASIYAEVGATGSAGYSASKGAVAALTRQMATDFGPVGIRVNAVAPGLIETPMTADRIRDEAWRRQIYIDQSPLRRVGKPHEVARAIAFLSGDQAEFITGETLRVDGGWAVGRYPRPGA